MTSPDPRLWMDGMEPNGVDTAGKEGSASQDEKERTMKEHQMNTNGRLIIGWEIAERE